MTSSRPPRRILLTGASRGLGLAFTRLWLEAGEEVFALSRTAPDSPALRGLAEAHPGTLHLAACDVGDDAAVEEAGRMVATAWDRLDIALNVAGIYGQRVRRLEDLDLEDTRRVFEVNTLGPLRVSRAILPLLRRGAAPRLVHITSLMGSIADNTSGGSHAYRMSKAALNMASRSLAHELEADGVICAVVHPGWVRTDMGGPDAPLAIEESVPAMIRTIENLSLDQSGGFFDRDGRAIPW
ncbi:MAG: SDR family oxidoreductase [Acidobacteriota bacterium]